MALSNFGSLILNLLIFITTLVNFSYALTALEPLVLLGLLPLRSVMNVRYRCLGMDELQDTDIRIASRAQDLQSA
ncbi:hypothetical protein VE03_08961 [Pseudogymnoascus sp. 23342-1-I1]|nr:hypothetical protein VE03_08961 [Pseudogymnoascus sp. 23342-1-I1]